MPMQPHEIVALMQRDETGKPYWFRRIEQDRAVTETSYAEDFKARHGFAPVVEAAAAEGEDADYRALFAARFGREATA